MLGLATDVQKIHFLWFLGLKVAFHQPNPPTHINLIRICDHLFENIFNKNKLYWTYLLRHIILSWLIWYWRVAFDCMDWNGLNWRRLEWKGFDGNGLDGKGFHWKGLEWKGFNCNRNYWIRNYPIEKDWIRVIGLTTHFRQCAFLLRDHPKHM